MARAAALKMSYLIAAPLYCTSVLHTIQTLGLAAEFKVRSLSNLTLFVCRILSENTVFRWNPPLMYCIVQLGSKTTVWQNVSSLIRRCGFRISQWFPAALCTSVTCILSVYTFPLTLCSVGLLAHLTLLIHSHGQNKTLRRRPKKEEGGDKANGDRVVGRVCWWWMRLQGSWTPDGVWFYWFIFKGVLYHSQGVTESREGGVRW